MLEQSVMWVGGQSAGEERREVAGLAHQEQCQVSGLVSWGELANQPLFISVYRGWKAIDKSCIIKAAANWISAPVT